MGAARRACLHLAVSALKGMPLPAPRTVLLSVRIKTNALSRGQSLVLSWSAPLHNVTISCSFFLLLIDLMFTTALLAVESVPVLLELYCGVCCRHVNRVREQERDGHSCILSSPGPVSVQDSVSVYRDKPLKKTEQKNIRVWDPSQARVWTKHWMVCFCKDWVTTQGIQNCTCRKASQLSKEASSDIRAGHQLSKSNLNCSFTLKLLRKIISTQMVLLVLS